MRNTVLHQFLLEDTALGIRAVQNGKIIVCAALLFHQGSDLSHHNLSFFHVRVRLCHLYLFASFLLREHLLVYPVLILMYKAVGSLHYDLCRTVVLFQFKQSAPFVAVPEREDIVDIGTTETVYAL